MVSRKSSSAIWSEFAEIPVPECGPDVNDELEYLCRPRSNEYLNYEFSSARSIRGQYRTVTIIPMVLSTYPT